MNIESLLHRSRAVAGVLYAEDFDAPDLPSPPEPEAIEPTFSLAELEEARAEARAAARLDAEESQAAARLRALEAIGAGLDAARDTAREDAAAASEAIARTMLGALTACLPSLCVRYGAAEVRTLARAVLPALMDEPRITVRLSPHDARMLAEEIARLEPELAARISLAPTDAVPRGDLRIAWQDGLAVRDAAASRAAVHDALSALGLIDSQELAHV